jgi:serine/threonine protein kinase
MFIDEAKLAAQLNHNNIIHIYDLGKEDAYHYIAMEYIEGRDLRSILKTATEKGYPFPSSWRFSSPRRSPTRSTTPTGGWGSTARS